MKVLENLLDLNNYSSWDLGEVVADLVDSHEQTFFCVICWKAFDDYVWTVLGIFPISII